MVSPAVNVVRYTALASGIVYGIVHRKTLQERFDKSAAEKEVQQRAHWLEEAKKAWEAQKLQGKSGVVTDPEAPNFDLEALLKSYEK
ncbi:ATP synthase subunit e, mitochondrial [Rhodotorula toruloides]|uniref:ATP synthase F(0) complex subunit e, mitochondrial n=1 Tax=Rhodotorula toruloides TaxID=5286 RepID=A0A0K3CMR3_RHOTO|nr:ATP synthase subunit e, mitochondrial [Rhodotorula toruloides]